MKNIYITNQVPFLSPNENITKSKNHIKIVHDEKICSLETEWNLGIDSNMWM